MFLVCLLLFVCCCFVLVIFCCCLFAVVVCVVVISVGGVGGLLLVAFSKDLPFLVDFVVTGTMYLKVLESYIMITGSYKLHCQWKI